MSDGQLNDRGGGRRGDPQGSQTRSPNNGGGVGQMLSGPGQRPDKKI